MRLDFGPHLQLDHEGKDVGNLQAKLKQQGYDIEKDGRFGSATQAVCFASNLYSDYRMMSYGSEAEEVPKDMLRCPTNDVFFERAPLILEPLGLH